MNLPTDNRVCLLQKWKSCLIGARTNESRIRLNEGSVCEGNVPTEKTAIVVDTIMPDILRISTMDKFRREIIDK